MKSDPRASSLRIHEWTCGHKANDCCAECHRLLAAKAGDLQRIVDDMTALLRDDLPAVLGWLKDRLPPDVISAMPELRRGGIDLLQAHAKRAVEDYERTAAGWLRGEGNR